jgi:hypothetical protein
MRFLPALFPFPSQLQHLDPQGQAALEETRYPPTEYRIGDLLGRFRKLWGRACAGQDIESIRFRGKRRLHKGDKCYAFDVWFEHQDDGGDEYPFRQVVLGFDPETLLLVVQEAYRAAPRVGDRTSRPVRPGADSRRAFYSTRIRDADLQECYHFRKLRVDRHLSSEDFSESNPEYRFRDY